MNEEHAGWCVGVTTVWKHGEPAKDHVSVRLDCNAMLLTPASARTMAKLLLLTADMVETENNDE